MREIELVNTRYFFLESGDIRKEKSIQWPANTAVPRTPLPGTKTISP